MDKMRQPTPQSLSLFSVGAGRLSKTTVRRDPFQDTVIQHLQGDATSFAAPGDPQMNETQACLLKKLQSHGWGKWGMGWVDGQSPLTQPEKCCEEARPGG